jgi:catechol 2,3-dioxygenase-like lactoylglutathione lyase family enzyme
MSERDPPPDFAWAASVPELLVSDLDRSRRFWCGLCGFRVAYERPEDRFVYLDRDGIQVMLEEVMAPGRRWITGVLEPPFGRGINLQMTVEALEPIRSALREAGWPLFLEPEEVWYRAGTLDTGVRQFLVQDPDGYLLRFAEALGTRRATTR